MVVDRAAVASQSVEFVGVGDGAAIVFCSQSVEFVCVGDGAAIVICSRSVEFAAVRDGAALVICNPSVEVASCHVSILSCMFCHVAPCRVASPDVVSHLVLCHVTSP